MPPRAPIAVVGAIIRHDDTVFAARRHPSRSAGGLWEFPGGKVEHGETPQEALVRELREELSIEIIVGELASRHTTPLGEVFIDLACYWATLANEAPVHSTDHDALRWVPLDEVHTLDWSPADVPIVSDIRR